MKIKELMLNNWVLAGVTTQFPMQVIGIFNDIVYLDFEGNEGDVWEKKENDILPIPLTKELLIKNGFENINGNFFFFNKDFEINIHNNNFLYFINREDHDIAIEKPIKYVHQLQNILTMAGIEFNFKY